MFVYWRQHEFRLLVSPIQMKRPALRQWICSRLIQSSAFSGADQKAQ